MLAGTGVMLGLFATGWVLAWQGFDPMIGQATRFRPYYFLGLEPIVWGLAASLLAGVGVSLVTSPPPLALVRRLFEALPDPREHRRGRVTIKVKKPQRTLRRSSWSVSWNVSAG